MVEADLFPPSPPFEGLRLRHYRCILADPPWRFLNFSEAGEGKNPSSHYSCMPLDEIKALPVSMIAAADCALTMWATAPLLPQAIEVLTAWGFTFKSAGAWAKRSSTDTAWQFGPGYVFRSATEFYIVGTRGDPKPRAKNVRNLIVAPVREHSRKPARMHEDLEALWPEPRLELFGRESRQGWTVWGNEATKFDENRAEKAGADAPTLFPQSSPRLA